MAIKTSSRMGRFKKKLVSAEVLLIEAEPISLKLQGHHERYKSGAITGPEFVAAYLITILAHRHPGTWLGAKRPHFEIQHEMKTPLSSFGFSFEPNIQKRLEGIQNLGELFSSFAFKATPETVNRAILSWSNGSYGLELMFRIPTPVEVLDQQKQGRRCVTVITKANQLKNYILGERDALSFTMHDLIHADHFYHHNESYQGQLGFYGFLDHCMKENYFTTQLESEKFQGEFEYLIADMNAYAVHLMKCLKSALVFYHQDGENFFNSWVNKITTLHHEKNAWKKLNTSEYEAQSQDIHLLNFLERFKTL